MNTKPINIAVCIPVFNDWDSVAELIRALSHEHNLSLHNMTILLVDDGSTAELDAHAIVGAGTGRCRIEVLELNRNVGHQRAIAIGLACLAERAGFDAVVVMDGDGEDNPADVAALIGAMESQSIPPVVFARRSRRTEGLVFRLGYFAFQALHRLLTGFGSDIGNFSIVPSRWLKRIVHMPELWNHYAAAVIASKLPVAKVSCPRSRRYYGQSHMNLVSLVAHGLRAISVFGETVGVRVCLALGALIALSTLALCVILYIKLMTDLAIPGWATSASGLTLILLVNLLVLTAPALLLILHARSNAGFVPARDWRSFVSTQSTICER